MATMTVDSLLMPGTPDDVAERYRTLSARAARADFGPLADDVVVIDTETTGLSFRDCELIQIAAARLEGGEIAERFDTFVHPRRPIPAEIAALTGIVAADVADAPDAEQAVAALADFAGGMPMIAHNATFDRTFVERVRGGRDVSDVWIDTLALSRIALPRLSTHRLADMACAFGCARVTHRAGDDVDALAGMWRVLLAALGDLPAGLAGLLAGMHPEVSWAFRPILAYLATEGVAAGGVAVASEADALAEGGKPTGAAAGSRVGAGGDDGQPFSLRDVRKLLCGATPHVRGDIAERASRTVPTADDVRAAFAPGGVVSAMYGGDGYEDRPEQLAMALEVLGALSTGTHRAIEAGTGVGKSVAYLVPEVLFARMNDATVGVATKTNALTDQLVARELPALGRALPGGVTFAALKGYDHYPCLRKLERATVVDLPPAAPGAPGGADAAAQEMLTALAVTYAFACQSAEGDLDALGIRWRYVPRDLLTVTHAECQRGHCPFYPNLCLLHGARRRAAAADVVVTNHSLLLRNVEADGKILPPVRNWVVDEAHAFEGEARRQWAVEVGTADVRHGFEQLGGTRTGAIRAVLAQVGRLDGAALHTRLLTKLSAAVSRASVSCGDLFDALHGLGTLASGGGYDQVSVWIDERVRMSDEWAALADAGWVLVDRLDEAVRDLAGAVEALGADSAQLASDLADAGRFLRDLHAALTLVLEGEDRTYVYAAEVSRRRQGTVSERLVAEKVDVGADLAARWLPEMESVVFSSATIAVGSSFEHFDHAVGLDLLPAAEHREVQLESSFDFDAHMAVVVCRDLPAPGSRAHLAALEDLLYDVHVAMGGSVLTLFTNRREMETVYQGLRGRLAAVGLDVACQERGSSPRRLREQFVADKALSLLALRTFWEGFDAAGDTLRCVVIPKLPFANPNDPLVRERETREDRSWWRYSLPEAVISVKQAAGRLIRSKSDTGVLVLADSRLVTKRYGRRFIASLPSKNVSELGVANVSGYLEAWRRGHDR